MYREQDIPTACSVFHRNSCNPDGSSREPCLPFQRSIQLVFPDRSIFSAQDNEQEMVLEESIKQFNEDATFWVLGAGIWE